MLFSNCALLFLRAFIHFSLYWGVRIYPTVCSACSLLNWCCFWIRFAWAREKTAATFWRVVSPWQRLGSSGKCIQCDIFVAACLDTTITIIITIVSTYHNNINRNASSTISWYPSDGTFKTCWLRWQRFRFFTVCCCTKGFFICLPDSFSNNCLKIYRSKRIKWSEEETFVNKIDVPVHEYSVTFPFSCWYCIVRSPAAFCWRLIHFDVDEKKWIKTMRDFQVCWRFYTRICLCSFDCKNNGKLLCLHMHVFKWKRCIKTGRTFQGQCQIWYEMRMSNNNFLAQCSYTLGMPTLKSNRIHT